MSNRRRFANFVIAAASLLVVSAIPWQGDLAGARAHSWYPHYCCSDQDCMKVDRIEYVTGGMYMITGETRIFVPESMEKRPSLDGDAHICILRTQSGRYRLRCVFLPGTA